MSSFDEMEKMLKAVFDDTDVQVIAYDENGPREITTPKHTSPVEYIPKSLREQFPDWVLRRVQSGDSVLLGDTITRADGEQYVITGGRPPHHGGSTGRVYVKYTFEGEEFTAEYFPSVVDLKWIHRSEYEEGA